MTGSTLALGVAAGLALGPVATPSAGGSDFALTSAEQVASGFVQGFESYGTTAAASSRVAGLATGSLAATLASASASPEPDALLEEHYQVKAHVTNIEVASASSSTVLLLVDTELTVSTTAGTTTVTRVVAVTLVHTGKGWRVREAGGIGGTGLSLPGAVEAAPPAPTPVPNTAQPSVAQGVHAGSGAAPQVTTVSATLPTAAVGDIPARYVSLFVNGALAQCPGLSWSVLAGIGKVESDFGRSKLPGVSSGANSAGAEGPMQFEPATFRAYKVVAPGGADPASPYDPADAVYSAAHLLCVDGAAHAATLYDSIFDYNHSDAYVQLVLAYAAQYAGEATGGGIAATEATATKPIPGPSHQSPALASVVIADAQAYLATPYVWGGESPRGFDCSGLVQWVFAEAGVHLPRVAQGQYDAGPILAKGTSLVPGDLVFFGSGPHGVEHVGIYVGNGEMIDAPFTGAVVRYDSIAHTGLGFVGATRPETPDVSSAADVPVFNEPSGGGTVATISDTTATGPGSGAGHAPSHHGPKPTPTSSSSTAPSWPARSSGSGSGHTGHRPGEGGSTTTTSTTTTSPTDTSTSSTSTTTGNRPPGPRRQPGRGSSSGSTSTTTSTTTPTTTTTVATAAAPNATTTTTPATPATTSQRRAPTRRVPSGSTTTTTRPTTTTSTTTRTSNRRGSGGTAAPQPIHSSKATAHPGPPGSSHAGSGGSNGWHH
ncbi:MAG: C40 family peptidase [Acidimicrobiales bacterium]